MPPTAPAPVAFDVAGARGFETALGPALFERATIFPLHGFAGERCACGKPTCPPQNAGKHPAILWNPEDFPNGSKMLRRPDGLGIGLGLATGSRSGGLVVLDLDLGGGKDGAAALQELEQVYGPLPATLATTSPTGGRHLYFLAPPSARIKSSTSEIAEGVDVRAEGGYAVLPGSPHRKGGHYQVTSGTTPPAPLPAAWLEFLPKAGERAATRATPDLLVNLDPGTIRQRLADTAKGKRDPESAAFRRVVAGERMFRIEGGPGDPDALPLVHGVDTYMTQSLIWGLVTRDDWHLIPAMDVASLFAASLSLLRQDAAAAGTGSKWFPDYFAQKWAIAAEKVAGDRAEAQAFVDRLTAATVEAKTGPLPFVLQLDDRYWILDDRDPDATTYRGPIKGVVLRTLAEQLWPGKGRVLDVERPKVGTVPMTPAEIVAAYGRAITDVVVDYTATAPRLADHTYIRGPARPCGYPEAREDRDVAGWLAVLAGPDLDVLVSWIVWARPDLCGMTVPALAMIGGSHVGKSLLADGLARCAGLYKAAPLKRSMGRFGAVLADSPILFSDEGLPTSDNGRPMTEEFRALVTGTAHQIEQKGIDRSLIVLGGVRAVLAANKADRLFANRGALNGHDVSALLRRLLVLDIEGEGRIADAKARAVALGACEGDPIRLERVAGHFRWLQTVSRPDAPAPAPRAGALGSELRKGGDLARSALEALEDGAGTAVWIAGDRAGGLVWVQPELWARAAGIANGAGPLTRAIAPYIRRPSAKFTRHPVTDVKMERRERWAALDLERLAKDGIDLTGLDPAGTPR